MVMRNGLKLVVNVVTGTPKNTSALPSPRIAAVMASPRHSTSSQTTLTPHGQKHQPTRFSYQSAQTNSAVRPHKHKHHRHHHHHHHHHNHHHHHHSHQAPQGSLQQVALAEAKAVHLRMKYEQKDTELGKKLIDEAVASQQSAHYSPDPWEVCQLDHGQSYVQSAAFLVSPLLAIVGGPKEDPTRSFYFASACTYTKSNGHLNPSDTKSGVSFHERTQVAKPYHTEGPAKGEDSFYFREHLVILSGVSEDVSDLMAVNAAVVANKSRPRICKEGKLIKHEPLGEGGGHQYYVRQGVSDCLYKSAKSIRVLLHPKSKDYQFYVIKYDENGELYIVDGNTHQKAKIIVDARYNVFAESETGERVSLVERDAFGKITKLNMGNFMAQLYPTKPQIIHACATGKVVVLTPVDDTKAAPAPAASSSAMIMKTTTTTTTTTVTTTTVQASGNVQAQASASPATQENRQDHKGESPRRGRRALAPNQCVMTNTARVLFRQYRNVPADRSETTVSPRVIRK